MIELESISFRNFLSYGDYLTEINLSRLGPCLITGANGSGKSTIVNAILYPFFGRTMHAARPGDRIVNKLVNKDCLVSARLKNGDIITRTRKMTGHNELVVERQGEPILSTLSTTPNQQAQLNRLYDLDWHTFCNTAFLTQIGRTWFEMPEPQRKKEIERALRIDRLTLRAQVTKAKLDTTTRNQTTLRQQAESLQQQIESIAEDIGEAKQSEVRFEDQRSDRLKGAIAQARDYKSQYDAIAVPDLEHLRQRWVAIENARQAAQRLADQVRDYQRQESVAAHAEREAVRLIKLWEDKAGKVCTACRQEVSHTHTDAEIMPYRTTQTEAAQIIETSRAANQRTRAKIAKVEEAIATTAPALSIREAEAILARRIGLIKSAQQWADQATKIKSETNPHATLIVKLEARLAEKTTKQTDLTSELERLDVLVKHYSYIFKSYNDRRKIKSFSVAKYRPLLNSRFKHYLDKFKLGIDIEITDSLGVDTSGADYDFMSGGERKRVDASFMLARFDVREALYGRQSNVIVLDEVDARMDAEGVECLADIILNDLATRVDTILVISHQQSMRDIFPNQIRIGKQDKLSYVDEMR